MSNIILGSRALFPQLKHHYYLNHAAVSPISTPVADVIKDVVQDYAKYGVSAFPKWMDQKEQLRQKIASMIGADAKEIAFIPNTSAGVIQVAQNLRWKKGDRICLLQGEFPTNITPWQESARHNNLSISWLQANAFKPNGNGLVLLKRELDKGLRLLAISAVQFQTGLRMPLKEISRLCQSSGCLLFVDAIQAIGSIPIDITDIDFMSCGSHKWLMGIEGAGFLYAKQSKQSLISKVSSSWISHDEPFSFLFEGEGHLRYNRPIKKDIRSIEGGSFNTLGLAALEASIDILLELGVDEIYHHISLYLDHLEPMLVELGFQSLREQEASSGILALKPPVDINGKELISVLEENGVSAAFPDGNIRLSPHWPNALHEPKELSELFQQSLKSLR